MKRRFPFLTTSPGTLRITARNHHPLIWVILHLLLIIPGFLLRPVEVDTSFFSILPVSREKPALADAESKLQQNLNNRIQILVGSNDFPSAYQAGETLSGLIADIPGVDSVTWKTMDLNQVELRSFIDKNRYSLINREDREFLINDSAEILASDAVSQVFSPMSFAYLGNIDEDPFLITNRILKSYLDSVMKSGGRLTLRDGVLATEYGDRNYVMIGVELSESSMSSKTVPEILQATDTVKNDNTEVILSGFPLHSEESSRIAQNEITLITSISLTLLTLILLISFKSVIPWLASVLMIGIGAVAAFSQTILLFGNIHIFTLVFGTSLIGITIDYSLHFFVEWRIVNSGKSIVARIFPGISMGMLTTILSYAALALTPVPLLRQIAVFSITGLVSAFLTVTLIFPLLPPPNQKKYSGTTGKYIILDMGKLTEKDSIQSIYRIASPALVAMLFLLGFPHLKLKNDLSDFYTMSEHLKNDEISMAEITDSKSRSRYFMILGNNAEDMLQKEELLGTELSKLTKDSKIGGWMGISRFLPSQKTQALSRDAALHSLPEKAPDLFSVYGFPETAAENWFHHLEIETSSSGVSFGEMRDQSFSSYLETFYIGKTISGCASIVLVSDVADITALENIKINGVYWMETIKEINTNLQDYSIKAIIIIALSYLIITIVLSFLRGIGAALRISLSPVLAVLGTLGIIGIFNQPFNLFSVFGLILTLGIGIDYTIFLHESGNRRRHVVQAIILSSISTILSFGVLSLSSFSPVADFGWSVLWGVLLSIFLAPLAVGTITEKTSLPGEKDSRERELR